MSVKVTEIINGSIAKELGIKPGDFLLSINENEIEDILDYDFYVADENIELLISRDKEQFCFSVEKDDDEDLGLRFSSYLMDREHSCKNDCIFCFVNQMPPGMRNSLYFKDDDERLSFLFGNYITLTNLRQRDVDRIVKMHISPINVSVHTTDERLRCEMMKNKFAGDSLKYLKLFAKGGIKLNLQIVLCPEYNDGENLRRSLRDFLTLGEAVQSVAIVPVGLTKYREGLPELRPFSREEAADTIKMIESFGKRSIRQTGRRVFFPSDEWFLLADMPIPDVSYYEDLLQLENGVGMSALLKSEFIECLEKFDLTERSYTADLATGEAAYPLICELRDMLIDKMPNLSLMIHKIKNEFFGGNVTVAGLITGSDLSSQLIGKLQSKTLLLPDNMLRYTSDCFLDDVTPAELEKELDCKVVLCENSGSGLLEKMTGEGSL